MSRNRFLVPIGLLLFVALCLVPTGQAQLGNNFGQPNPLSFASGPAQLAVNFTFSSSSTQTTAFNTGGIGWYYMIWIPSGTVSTCTLTVDGAPTPGGTFTTGSLVASQTCTGVGSITSSSAVFSDQAKVTPTITGSGSVSVFLFGYVNNPTTSGGGGGNVTIVNPLDGSGYVNVHCQSGCTGGNPNGQALMANSAPVVIASNQSNLPANVTQFGGVNVSTGTGASGTGIPRVTVSNDSSLAANQSVNVNQVAGAASSATNPLFVGIADGTTGAAAVKAASTGAAAADKALVVQLSPNTPNLTTGLNVSNTQSGTASQNVAQFGGSSVVTGTGAGGAGIPRVTVSNDSTVSQTLSAGAVISGQQAVTASAVALTTTSLTRPACLTALSTNTLTVYVGPSGVTTATGFPLPAGASLCNIPVSNLNQLFVIATSTGSSVAWVAQ